MKQALSGISGIETTNPEEEKRLGLSEADTTEGQTDASTRTDFQLPETKRKGKDYRFSNHRLHQRHYQWELPE